MPDRHAHRRPRRAPRATLALAGFVLAVATGCDLPGLPGEPRDVGELGPDGGLEAGVDGGDRVCTPGESLCRDNNVRTCRPDGEGWEVERCGRSALCRAGSCQPYENNCQGELPFSVSATDLAFDSNGQLRPVTDEVEVENCSSQTIEIAGVTIDDAPAPRDDSPFWITNRGDLTGLRLAPRESIAVRLEYAPTNGYFAPTANNRRGRDRPSLVLDIRALTRHYLTEIDLTARLDCVSTESPIDLEGLSAGETRLVDIPFYNCGTERQAVFLADLDGRTGSQLEATHPAGTIEPLVIRPGEEGSLPLDVRLPAAANSGDMEGRLQTTLPFPTLRHRSAGSVRPNNRRVTLRTSLDDACRTAPEEDPPTPPRFRVGPEPVDEDDDLQQRWSATVAPFQTLQFVPDDKPPGPFRFALADRPDRSNARIERVDPRDGPPVERLVPDVPGDYAIEVAHRAAGGGCATATFELTVRPQAPLYVELDWKTVFDPMPGDEGWGTGADLNLHVLADPDDPDNRWQDSRADCFYRGLRPPILCNRNQGRVVATSAGGAHPEAIAFDRVDETTFAVAVQAWNMYEFAAAQPAVRLWYRGELVTKPTVSTVFSGRDGTVWLVGRFDGKTGEFTPVDEIQKAF